MIGLALCALSFALCYNIARSSLAKGIGVMLVVGYLYGITRANIDSAFVHFWFDFSLLGLYAAQLWRGNDRGDPVRNSQLLQWLFLLMLWPTILALMPLEPLPIALVGLRSNIFFLPLILLGARLTEGDLQEIGSWLIWLNLMALAFGLAEYLLGIKAFFPENAKTFTIYASSDVGEERFHRIPSCFSVAHAYGGTMVMSIPFLFGAWVQPCLGHLKKLLCVAGLLAALFGVMLSATRINFIAMVIAMLVANTTVRIRPAQRVAFVLVLVVVGVVVAENSRLQRFTTLKQTDYVRSRVKESVNEGFWDLLRKYPMGNGLAGGGTSIPYFLQHLAKNNTPMENEFARILMEQGVVGLALMICFVIWVVTRGSPVAPPMQQQSTSWGGGRRVARACALSLLATGMIGIGLFVSIPQSVLLFLCIGWVAAGAPWVVFSAQEAQVAVPPRMSFLWPRRAAELR